MGKLKGACIFGQSGGPTAVINTSALGVIQTAFKQDCITKVYGAAHGIRGILDDVLYDLSYEDPKELELLRTTPSSALGSCRYKLKKEEDFARILEIFKKYDIRYFFYNGGNDSMDTCNKISKYLEDNNYECRVMGVPKTIDNDLSITDHCPGFGSAAKYIITSCMEIYLDARVYDQGMITVVELMGRNAGWLTASTALATYYGYGPDLIYVPEVVFDIKHFYAVVESIYNRDKKCIIAVSEGIHDGKGRYIAEYGSDLASQKDSFGHAQMGGLANTLANALRNKTGAKVRGVELSLLQRCASHLISKTDADEAYESGKAAVESAVAGISGKMVGFECTRENGYECKIKLIDLKDVANVEKKIPRDWINADGTGLEQPLIDYIEPLIQGEVPATFENGVPKFAKLKKVRAKI